jgi:putative addiction module component (TIGR02574 family)
MVETIWDSIIEEDHQLELSSETKQFLEERLLDHNANREEGSSWDDVKERIKNQF